jgi:hypothetical protein
MKDGLFSIAVALSIVGVGSGAAPPSRLDRILRDWASASERVGAAEYHFTLTEHDKAFGNKTTSKGVVRFCKPGYLQMQITQGKTATSVVFTPEAIHLLDPGRQTECVMPWPKDRSFFGATEPNRPWGQFGLTLRDAFAQERYWIWRGLPPLELSKHFRLRLAKEDPWYVYLEGAPRNERAKGYRFLQVVLTRQDHRLKRLYWEVPNGNTFTFEIEGYDPAAKVSAQAIRESLPRDYRRLDMTKQ